MTFSSNLNINIAQAFKTRFEESCVELFLDSFYNLTDKQNLREQSENNVTARLVGQIKKNPLRSQLNISIDRESYLDTELTYEGSVDADESARIDLKWTVWNSDVEYEYFIEAKNICENDWKKSTVATPVSAKKLQERYISTGIQNFISGRYPCGCLVAYVMEGDCDRIVEKLNEILISSRRDAETIVKALHPTYHQFYSSHHKGTKSPRLQHYFLMFA